MFPQPNKVIIIKTTKREVVKLGWGGGRPFKHINEE